jgi:hypothetical protein
MRKAVVHWLTAPANLDAAGLKAPLPLGTRPDIDVID